MYDDVTYVYGDVTYVYADVTYVYADVTYVYDDVSVELFARLLYHLCVCVCVCVCVVITLNGFVGVNVSCVSCGEWCRWKGEQHSDRLTHDSCVTRASGEWWWVLTPVVLSSMHGSLSHGSLSLSVRLR